MRIAIFVVLLMSTTNALACDACGSAMGSGLLGITSTSQKHFIGLKYASNRFQSTHFGDETIGADYMHSSELRLRTVFFKKVQIMAQVPYLHFFREEGDEQLNYQGIGDANLWLNYTLLNNTDSLYARIKHSMQAGGGVNFPTGNNNIIWRKRSLPNPIQLGSGSFDYLFNVAYTARYNFIGVNLEGIYRLNTENQKQYKNGNQTIVTGKVFGRIVTGQVVFLPAVSVNYFQLDPNFSYQREVEFTGGEMTTFGLGLSVFYKQLAVSVDMQKPIKQNLNEGQTIMEPSFFTQLTYYF